MNLRKRVIFLGSLIGVLLGLTLGGVMGCGSSHHTLNEIEKALGGGGGNPDAPFLEAYVEYGGPHRKYGGPESFLVHVDAKSLHGVGVAVSPRRLAPAGKRGVGHAPASSVTTTQMRGRLKALAQALEEKTAHPYRGCLYPVRVRFLRSGGGVVEQEGCRGEGSWSVEVSQFVAEVLK